MPGTLYVISTPIGNLKDITLRAIDTLKTVDIIACEDTRHTKKLLSHYGITTSTTSYFEYNKIKKGRYLMQLLEEGRDIGLVSDSGTPGISDPGYNIISLAIEKDIHIVAIPGPCAFISALILSGMPTDNFLFCGFLSHKSSKRRRQLELLKGQPKTIILYESPHRLLKALQDMLDIFGDRDIFIARELTKVFEELLRLKVSGAIRHFTTSPPRGEFILVVKGEKS